jgi:DeoR/GlpR family transcriptional regulator of sugar metabolism
MNTEETQYAEERQARMLELLRQQGRLDVKTLIETLGVSGATVRRDLAELEGRSLLRRTHGGALPPEYLKYDAPFTDRETKRVQEKARIGRAAAGMVKEGETIFIDAGTTTLQVARNLIDRNDLTVVTNALNVCATFTGVPSVEIFFLGGQFREINLARVGPFTVDMAKQFNADKAIIGVNAIDVERGLISTPNVLEARVQRAIIEAAETVIVVADHTKFGRRSLAVIAPVSDIDFIVTDKAVLEEYVMALEEKGVRIVQA